MVAANNPNEIRLIRTYDAPVQVVWDAWNDPEQAAKWWGPRGFTLTTHSKDLRPGGHWSYTMHGPDGVDYENRTIYYEVEHCQKLVYDHGGGDDRPPLFRVTVLFSESNGKTTMDLTMRLPTAEEAEQTRKFIKAAGGNGTWDRLAEYLDQMQLRKTTFVMNRSFEASAEKLFQLWIEPQHLARWLPPPGFSMSFQSTDVRVGGKSFFKMSSANETLYGELEYREIDTPNQLVYIQRFCNEHGLVGRHPALPLFPESLLMTVQFTVEDESATRVTLMCEPFGAASQAEVETFLETRTSMASGWSASFDALEAML